MASVIVKFKVKFPRGRHLWTLPMEVEDVDLPAVLHTLAINGCRTISVSKGDRLRNTLFAVPWSWRATITQAEVPDEALPDAAEKAS